MKRKDLINLLRSCASTSCPAECPFSSDIDICECSIMNAAADMLEKDQTRISALIGFVAEWARDEDINAQVSELCDPQESGVHRKASDRLISLLDQLALIVNEQKEEDE